MITRKELFSLNFNPASHIKCKKLVYAIHKNFDKIKQELELVNKTFQITDEMKEFDAKRFELINKYGKKDSQGNLMHHNNQYPIDNTEAFDKEYAELEEQYPEAVQAEKEKEKFLDEEIEFEFFKIPFDELPADICEREFKSIKHIVEM